MAGRACSSAPAGPALSLRSLPRAPLRQAAHTRAVLSQAEHRLGFAGLTSTSSAALPSLAPQHTPFKAGKGSTRGLLLLLRHMPSPAWPCVKILSRHFTGAPVAKTELPLQGAQVLSLIRRCKRRGFDPWVWKSPWRRA